MSGLRIILCGVLLAGMSCAGAWGQTASAVVKVPAFEVVSIKPSAPSAPGAMWGIMATQFQMKGMTLRTALMQVYFERGMAPTNPIQNAPGWVASDKYDITAKYDEATVAAWKRMNFQQIADNAKPMIKAMLAERFKLAVHTEPTEVQGYALVVGKHGAKLKDADMSATLPSRAMPLPDGGYSMGYARDEAPAMRFFQAPIASVAFELSQLGALAIVDQTGLTGRYDIVLPKRETLPAAEGDASEPDDRALYWDLESLGLELKPMKMTTVRLVIDHIERPTAN